MSQYWFKFKLWSKGIFFALIALYAIVFVAMNWNVRVNGVLDFVFTKFENPRILAVLAATAVVSVIGWWLLRTVIRTVRQFRDLRARNQERTRTARLEREVAEMKKAAGGTTDAKSKAVEDEAE